MHIIHVYYISVIAVMHVTSRHYTNVYVHVVSWV